MVNRFRKLIFIVITIALNSMIFPACSYGMVRDDLAVEGLTENVKENLLYNTGLRNCQMDALKAGEPCELLVTPQWVAVGTTDYKVGVFDLNGEVLYTFRFTTTGQYELFYDSETNGLAMHIYRQGAYFYFDEQGQLMKLSDVDCPQESLQGSYETDEQGNRYELKQYRTIKDFWLYQYGQLVQKGENEKVFLESKFYIDPAPIALFLIMGFGGVGAYIGNKKL